MSTPSPLILSAELARQIESEGAAAYPNECCGILLGRDVRAGGDVSPPRRIVERLLPAANVFDSSERFHRFSISPKLLIDAEKIAADAGLLLVGFYHSHPDHPAKPSEYDRAHAWPFYSYIIVSIANRRAAEMTSWILDEPASQFRSQDITITNNTRTNEMAAPTTHPSGDSP